MRHHPRSSDIIGAAAATRGSKVLLSLQRFSGLTLNTPAEFIHTILAVNTMTNPAFGHHVLHFTMNVLTAGSTHKYRISHLTPPQGNCWSLDLNTPPDPTECCSEVLQPVPDEDMAFIAGPNLVPFPQHRARMSQQPALPQVPRLSARSAPWSAPTRSPYPV